MGLLFPASFRQISEGSRLGQHRAARCPRLGQQPSLSQAHQPSYPHSGARPLFIPALRVGRSYKDPPHSLQKSNNRTFAQCWTLCESHELKLYFSIFQPSLVSLNNVVNSKPVLNLFNPHILLRLPTPTLSLFLPNNSQVLWRSTSPTKFLLSLSLSHHQ